MSRPAWTEGLSPDWAEALAPDLLLLDIAMPGMDGIDVARELSRTASRPAVVFVTAFDQFAVSAFEVEAVDYLVKPVETARLERALERLDDLHHVGGEVEVRDLHAGGAAGRGSCAAGA